MEHIAIDLGSRESQVCIRDEVGTIVLERRVTTHDAVGSNLPRARPTRIHQREIDRRNSKQRDHRWFLRVALHAVMVRSVSQDRPRHDLSVYDFSIWARRLMRSDRPPSWPLCAAPSSFEIR